MLGIVLLFFIGRAFHRLAGAHGHSPWGYAVLSIVLFYAIQILLAFIPVFIWGLIDPAGADEFLVTLEERELLYSLLAAVLAGAGIVGLYYGLKRRWENNGAAVVEDPDLLDQPGVG